MYGAPPLTRLAPLALLLIVLAEGCGALPLTIHLLGLLLLLGRAASAWGLSRSLGPSGPRTAGAGITMLVTAAAALLLESDLVPRAALFALAGMQAAEVHARA